MTSRLTIRCAIYTRKSSDEGLDQAFNSLDAQYEACASYIKSQRHEGWKLVRARYDDGGLSGGTLDRPALQRLLAGIEAGRIQMIVVYKIDRLTRSLGDFARLVDRLEARNCSFVSVTQSFSTSSSMGRLTLNVLLSFAQFEREVTAERIRDKISASKKKGLWMGGVCPIGYNRDPDSKSRRLTVSPGEAETVRKIFELYDQLECLKAVEHAARDNRLRSKRHVFATGRTSGGGPFSRGQLYHILRNPIYRGLIRHKDKTYPGQHDAIIDPDLWDRVHEKLETGARRRRVGAGHKDPAKHSAPLIGKLYDETGDRLTPTHTIKDGRKLRYYISNRLISGGADPSGWRVSAPRLERQLAECIADHIVDRANIYALCADIDLARAEATHAAASSLSDDIRSSGVMGDVIEKAHLSPTAIEIHLNPTFLSGALKVNAESLSTELLSFTAPWQIKRRGVEAKLIIGDQPAAVDAVLIRMLAKAHEWVEQMKEGIPLSQISRAEKVTPAYIRTRSRLAFLSPKIQQAIVSGTLPSEYTLNKILTLNLPRDWQRQNSLFGL
jgi:site-specific DNA recombinase